MPKIGADARNITPPLATESWSRLVDSTVLVPANQPPRAAIAELADSTAMAYERHVRRPDWLARYSSITLSRMRSVRR
jgi:hypothetical protein